MHIQSSTYIAAVARCRWSLNLPKKCFYLMHDGAGRAVREVSGPSCHEYPITLAMSHTHLVIFRPWSFGACFSMFKAKDEFNVSQVYSNEC